MLIRSEREVLDYSKRQAFIPMANMLTTAAFLRIDACPVEGMNYEKMEMVLSEAGLLDLEHFRVAAMVSFGYRSQEPDHSKSRQAFENVVQYIG